MYPRETITLNELTKPAQSKITLRPGWNDLVLRLVQEQGAKIATYAALYDSDQPPNPRRFVPLLRWFQQPIEPYFDAFRADEPMVGWYRFDAPPGLSAFTVPIVDGTSIIGAWVNGQEIEVRENQIVLSNLMQKRSQITLKLEHSSGHYGGAAFNQPITFRCGVGEMMTGDWSNNAMGCYSGEVIYSRTFTLTPEHLQQRITLDLGRVEVAAEVVINGRAAGLRYARPYRYDISEMAIAGKNSIEIKVANTLANFYSEAFPTKFVLPGQTVSGLLGPVQIRFATPLIMTAHKKVSREIS